MPVLWIKDTASQFLNFNLKIRGFELNTVNTVQETTEIVYIFKETEYLYSNLVSSGNVFGNAYATEMILGKEGEGCPVKVTNIQSQDKVLFTNPDLKMSDLDTLYEGIYLNINKIPGSYELEFFIQPYVDIKVDGSVTVSVKKDSRYLFSK